MYCGDLMYSEDLNGELLVVHYSNSNSDHGTRHLNHLNNVIIEHLGFQFRKVAPEAGGLPLDTVFPQLLYK